MEAIITRAPAHRLAPDGAGWIRAAWRVARTAASAVGKTLVATSRAGLLLKNGSRPRRRF